MIDKTARFEICFKTILKLIKNEIIFANGLQSQGN